MERGDQNNGRRRFLEATSFRPNCGGGRPQSFVLTLKKLKPRLIRCDDMIAPPIPDAGSVACSGMPRSRPVRFFLLPCLVEPPRLQRVRPELGAGNVRDPPRAKSARRGERPF